jgi:thiol-disulfide isomerase/thioredoxin
MRHILFLLALALSAGSCIKVTPTYSKIPPGMYRATLQLTPNPIIPNPEGRPLPEKMNLEFEEATEGELPFNMEVTYETDSTFHIDIINGEERIRVPAEHIQFGHTRANVRDTIRIDFPVFDTYISAYFEENVIEGVWVVNYRENYRIPFTAYQGQDHRFTNLRKPPVADLSGTWEVSISGEEGPEPAIAEFEQDGNHLTGTFRTEMGDYRYLEGTVQADKMYLSVFDGSHAFLFEAKLRPDSTLVGTFRSGRHYYETWTARRNPDFQLADPDSLTTFIAGGEPLSFTFPDTDGNMVSLDDPQFSGKVKLVQIMGSWCPNCRDEANFLIDYVNNNPDKDVVVLALGFERYREEETALRSLRRYREKMNLPYPLLWGGYYDKREAAQQLPQLDRVLSYPTLLFVDRNNQVRRIYTGFNGPATSKYAEFKERFERTVDELLAEGEAM